MPAPTISDSAPEKGLLPLDAQDHAHRLFTTRFLHRFSLVLSPCTPLMPTQEVLCSLKLAASVERLHAGVQEPFTVHTGNQKYSFIKLGSLCLFNTLCDRRKQSSAQNC